MAWIYLIIAGLFEIGWPLGFKLASTTQYRIPFIAMSIVSMGLSGFFLFLAQRTIPMGTAYAIWTGIGTVSAFVIGIIFFNDPANVLKIVSATLIILGVIGLKLF